MTNSRQLETENKQLVRDAAETFFHRRDPSAVERYYAEDFVQHNVHAPPGRGGVRQFFDVIFTAFPDLQMRFDHLYAEGEMVFAFVTWSGTHSAEYFGRPPSHRHVTWRTAEIIRVADGKLVEHWDVVDDSGIAMPAPGAN